MLSRKIIPTIMRGDPRTFYVDATGGNDSNNGLFPGAAWQTIGKVNGYTFKAGDRILFKRGQTWTLTAALVPSANGLTLGAYGSGNKPILDGNLVADCVLLNGKSNITVENLDLRNGLDWGIACGLDGVPANNIIIRNMAISNPGNDGILIIDGAHDITIDTVTITTVRNRTGTYISTCIEVADESYDIMISNVTGTGSANHGLSVHAHNTEKMPYNVTVNNSSFNSNAQHGINILVIAGGLDADSPAITIDGVTCQGNTLQGLQIQRGDAVTPYPSNVTVKNCQFLDISNGVYAAYIRGSDHTFIRNIFDGTDRCVLFENVTDIEFYNNTAYASSGAAWLPVIYALGTGDGIILKNNIIATPSAAVLCISFADGAHVNFVSDYNLFYTVSGVSANRWSWRGTNSTWANWLINSSQDANSPTPANPLFTNAAGNDFTLQTGSPAIDKGVVIPGVTDGYLGTAPDCGYAEKA